MINWKKMLFLKEYMSEKLKIALFSSFEKSKEYSFEKSSSLINRNSTLLKIVVYVYQIS